jgi:hypothetical protein
MLPEQDIHNRYRKLIMVSSMTGHALLLTIPMGPRYFRCFQEEMCSLSSLNHLTFVYILFVLQAFFFASIAMAGEVSCSHE